MRERRWGRAREGAPTRRACGDLAVAGARVRYPGSRAEALCGVDLRLRPGERCCVLGANGSGKSTLAAVASGVLAPAGGTVSCGEETLVVGGRDEDLDGEGFARLHEVVGYVGQDPDGQLVATLVREEVAFGPTQLGWARAEVEGAVREALETCGIAALADRVTSTLSGGQRQLVVVAATLAMCPRYLVLDEPCAMLDERGSRDVRAALDAAAARGVGVLLVTHELADVVAYDRAIVMSEGVVAWTGAPREIARSEELRALACCLWDVAGDEGCRDEGSAPQDAGASTHDDRPDRPGGAAGSLCVRGVSLRTPDGFTCAFDGLVFEPGTCVLITGPTGAGKSTLLRLLAGLATPDEGEVAIADGRAPDPSVAACVFQRPADQLFAGTVLEEVMFGPRNLGRDAATAREAARDALERTGLDPDVFGARSPFSLSGGQMRRVCLASAVVMGTPFLLLDEPDAALDARGLACLRAQVAGLLARGVGVIAVTHHPRRLADLATRCYRVEGGRVTASWRIVPAGGAAPADGTVPADGADGGRGTGAAR